MGSPAYYSGLREFDQILQVNGYDVSDLQHNRVQEIVKSSGEMVSILTGDKDSVRYINDMGYLISDRSKDYAVQYSSPTPEPVVEETDRSRRMSIRRFSLNINSDNKFTSGSPKLLRKRMP